MRKTLLGVLSSRQTINNSQNCMYRANSLFLACNYWWIRKLHFHDISRHQQFITTSAPLLVQKHPMKLWMTTTYILIIFWILNYTFSKMEIARGYHLLWTGMGAQLARDVPFSAICWTILEPVSYSAVVFYVIFWFYLRQLGSIRFFDNIVSPSKCFMHRSGDTWQG
jgi:hypothetical protein